MTIEKTLIEHQIVLVELKNLVEVLLQKLDRSFTLTDFLF